MKANVYTEIDSVYISQIKRFPLLSANEESELAHRIAQGDRAALEKLVNSNLRLVITVALRFTKLSAPLMDLIQEGNMGLITAAHKFNGKYGTRFSTYAYPWIVQYMIRYMKTRVAAIVIPNRKDAMLKDMHKAREDLTLENGEAPSNSELAEYMGISESALRSLLKYDFSVSSLDMEVGDGEKATSLGDMLPDTTYSPEEQYMIREEKEEVRSLLGTLSANESKVLWYRFNFACDEKQKTLRDLSTLFGISPEAIRQTEIRAIRHLRRNVAV
ncbi:MAG: RNA polymerase sigma factor RpoD/SigA [Treponema sp.]|nr:RNA polymerase sigma factor RpoD/SigA [Treponema sp.]